MLKTPAQPVSSTYQEIHEDPKEEPISVGPSSAQYLDAARNAAAAAKGAFQKQIPRHKASEGGGALDGAWHTAQVAGEQNFTSTATEVPKDAPHAEAYSKRGDGIFSELERMVGGGP